MALKMKMMIIHFENDRELKQAKFVSTSFSALAPFIDISMTGQWDIEMQVERERWTFNSHDTLIAVFIMLEKKPVSAAAAAGIH